MKYVFVIILAAFFLLGCTASQDSDSSQSADLPTPDSSGKVIVSETAEPQENELPSPAVLGEVKGTEYYFWICPNPNSEDKCYKSLDYAECIAAKTAVESGPNKDLYLGDTRFYVDYKNVSGQGMTVRMKVLYGDKYSQETWVPGTWTLTGKVIVKHDTQYRFTGQIDDSCTEDAKVEFYEYSDPENPILIGSSSLPQ